MQAEMLEFGIKTTMLQDQKLLYTQELTENLTKHALQEDQA